MLAGAARNQSQRAVTLVEVLVTFTVLTVSIAIFAPVVLKVRDNTQASVCRSRMRHLAQGVLMFENLKRGLPAGAYLNDERSNEPTCNGLGFDAILSSTYVHRGCYDIFGTNGPPNYSWIVNVLPFIDREDLHDDFDFSRRAQDQVARSSVFEADRGVVGRYQSASSLSVVAKQIPTLICPTDGGNKANYDGTQARGFPQAREHGGFAKTNYVGFQSVSHIDHFKNREGAFGGFQIGIPVGQRNSQIADGQSNTLLVVEVRTLDLPYDSRGAWSLAFPGATTVAVDFHADPSTRGREGYTPDPNFDRESVALPNSPTYADIVVGAQVQVDYPFPTQSFTGAGAFLGAAPRSQHPGGVHASSLGGHVGLLSNDIDHVVYAYLVFTRDSEITDVDDYLDPSP